MRQLVNFSHKNTMTKFKMFNATAYEAPCCEVIAAEANEVLCVSFGSDQLPDGREDDWGIFE